MEEDAASQSVSCTILRLTAPGTRWGAGIRISATTGSRWDRHWCRSPPSLPVTQHSADPSRGRGMRPVSISRLLARHRFHCGAMQIRPGRIDSASTCSNTVGLLRPLLRNVDARGVASAPPWSFPKVGSEFLANENCWGKRCRAALDRLSHRSRGAHCGGLEPVFGIRAVRARWRRRCSSSAARKRWPTTRIPMSLQRQQVARAVASCPVQAIIAEMDPPSDRMTTVTASLIDDLVRTLQSRGPDRHRRGLVDRVARRRSLARRGLHRIADDHRRRGA